MFVNSALPNRSVRLLIACVIVFLAQGFLSSYSMYALSGQAPASMGHQPMGQTANSGVGCHGELVQAEAPLATDTAYVIQTTVCDNCAVSCHGGVMTVPAVNVVQVQVRAQRSRTSLIIAFTNFISDPLRRPPRA